MFRSPADTGLAMDGKDSLKSQLDMLNDFAFYNLDDDDGDADSLFTGTADRSSSSSASTASSSAHRYRQFDVGNQLNSNSPTHSTCSATSSTHYVYPRIETVDVLRPEEIRWLYKGERDKKWTAFIGYDSLRIECKYRELQHRKGTASIAKLCKKHSATKLANADNTVDGGTPTEDEQSENGNVDEETINVRGGLYQVNVLEKICFPIYWARTGTFLMKYKNYLTKPLLYYL